MKHSRVIPAGSEKTAGPTPTKIAVAHWLHTIGALAIFVSVCLLPQIAFGANPAEEIAKRDNAIGGGIDPAGDSWLSIQHSLEQFRHPEFMLRLLLSLALAVACAWVVAWHPRSTRNESLTNLEERTTLILLGMVGAVVAELSGLSPSVAGRMRRM